MVTTEILGTKNEFIWCTTNLYWCWNSLKVSNPFLKHFNTAVKNILGKAIMPQVREG